MYKNVSLLLLILVIEGGRGNNDLNVASPVSVDAVGTPWISNIIATGMINYYPYSKNQSNLCSQHGRLVQLFSSNYTLWALRMLDSYSKGPSGSIYGNVFDYGHYDQCISTSALNDTIKGQFVMLSIEFQPKEPFKDRQGKRDPTDNEFLRQDDSYWNLVEYTKSSEGKRARGRNKIQWAICVPESCSAEDIQYSVNRIMLPMLTRYGLEGNITVLEHFIRSANSASQNLASMGPIFFMSIIMIIVLIVSMATMYQWLFIDESSKHIGSFDRTLQKLSALYNLARLLKNYESTNSISGIKVISMFIIIYGHRMLISMFSPIHNSYDNEKGIGYFLNMYYMSGLLIVDTFLVVTGFLSFNKMLKNIESFDYFNPFKQIYRRYMRFTPTYATIIGYTIWIHPYLESGPLSHNIIWDSSGCSTSWWTHLLYINNYVHSKHQCMIPSWYLAADMQLYVFCTFIAYIMWRFKKRIGIILLIIASILSIIVPATILLAKGYKGITMLYLSDFASYYQNEEFIETYLQTHFRASPYIVGMLAALIYRKIEVRNVNEVKIRFKRILSFLTLIHMLSMNVAMLSAWWFYAPGADYSSIDSMLYGVLHRLGWAIPIAWIIVLHSSNIFAPFQKVLSFPLFGPLNQVGYSVFLIHTLFQLYVAGLNRAPVFYNWLTSWWMAAGDIVFSYGGAIALYLVIEAPFSNLLL